MTWTIKPIERERPPNTGPERDMLEGFLDYHRRTLLVKSSRLPEDRLKRAPVAPSGLSLLGLIRHLTEVEYAWFSQCVDRRPADQIPYYAREGDREVVFGQASRADPREAVERYRQAIADSQAVAARHGLDEVFEHPRFGRMSIRWLYLHMIEEYARHNGHADLIRESIDGVTGE
ncbi:DinB family protein [Glycomyces xiaoerkulensis]|uniref:DinB family protein n=1 Tax=Glycomyces xiaoerkulensis TaxID=2038139 RepID=UPI000C26A620|nr:DinB family protein [Glycomyces xiaoerkulensis]